MTFLPKSTMFCRCWNISSEVCKKAAQEGLRDQDLEEARREWTLPPPRARHTQGCHVCGHELKMVALDSEGEPRQRPRDPLKLRPLSLPGPLCLLPRTPCDPHLCQEHLWIPPAAPCIPSKEMDFENLSCPKLTRYLQFILQPLNSE